MKTFKRTARLDIGDVFLCIFDPRLVEERIARQIVKRVNTKTRRQSGDQLHADKASSECKRPRWMRPLTRASLYRSSCELYYYLSLLNQHTNYPVPASFFLLVPDRLKEVAVVVVLEEVHNSIYRARTKSAFVRPMVLFISYM